MGARKEGFLLIYLSHFLLATILSLDALAVGVAYGLRRIRMPWTSLLIISLVSGGLLATAMVFGVYLTRALSPDAGRRLGATVLIVAGILALRQAWQKRSPGGGRGGPDDSALDLGPKQILSFRLRHLGLVVQVVREPITADLDGSGLIGGLEALILGLALGLDGLAAGFGAGLAGFGPWFLSVAVGTACLVFFLTGFWVGKRLPLKNEGLWAYVPGAALTVLGILKLR